MSDLSEMANLLFRIPGVEDGFVQHTEDMGCEDFAPVAGAVGARALRYVRRNSFRVVLRVKNKTHETSAPALKDAVRTVLDKFGIKLASVIEEAEAALASAVAYPPQSGAEIQERWRKTVDDYRVTIGMLKTLSRGLAQP